MTGWPEVELGDHVELVAGFPFKSARYLDSPEGALRLLRGDNVAQGVLRWDGAKHWPEAERGDYAAFDLLEGDVILAMDRPWIEAGLKYAFVRPSDLPCLLVQRVARMRGANGLSTEFLRYIIGSSSFVGHVKSITTGVNVPHISGKDIKRFRFRLPPPSDQERIASILGAYDDLIEVNRRRIALLEEMARRLFEEWFVHISFPGFEHNKFVSTRHGRVPASWREVSVAEVCSTMQSGATPSRQVADFWRDGSVDWFTTGELQDRFLFTSKERIAPAALTAKKGRVFPAGTIFMAIYGAPTVGRIGIATSRCSSNQAALALQPNERLIGKWFLVHTLQRLRSHFNAIAQGAAQQNISKKKVASTTFFLPSVDLVKEFERLAAPAWELRRVLEQQQLSLAASRDLLLPRLISGDVSLTTVERDLEAAA